MNRVVSLKVVGAEVCKAPVFICLTKTEYIQGFKHKTEAMVSKQLMNDRVPGDGFHF